MLSALWRPGEALLLNTSIFFFLIKIMTPQNASMDEHSLQTSPNSPCFRTVSVCLSVCLNGRGSEEMPHLSMTKGFLIDGGGESS